MKTSCVNIVVQAIRGQQGRERFEQGLGAAILERPGLRGSILLIGTTAKETSLNSNNTLK
jgi:hypothetical protein